MSKLGLFVTIVWLLLVGQARAQCIGDCDRDRRVAINELVQGVNIALGGAPLAECPSFDCNESEEVTVDCIVRAVGAALNGCPSTVANPTVEGPITSGNGMPFIAATTFDLSQVGYTQAEYFLAGTAAAYVNVGPLTDDGLWTVEPGQSAAYRTRIVVYRPIDPGDFNGTVLVEWLNVSGGVDAAPDWILGHTEIIRSGYVWVGVSAQYVGVEGGPPLLGVVSLPLKMQDPVRYESLTHPGDSFSYDMFSQAAQALRHPVGINPLGELSMQAMIALGESQSAFRMVNYINAVHPIANLFDGFFVHSRGSISAPLSEAPQPAINVPGYVPIRADGNVPTLTFETEGDLALLGYYPARQPDTDRFRLWEVAGTAHADTYTITGMTDLGDSPDAAKLLITASPLPGIIDCPAPINSGPQHFVQKAALAALNRWVREGIAPPIAPRLEVMPGPPLTFVLDEHGNARGGVRTPYVDAPIARFSGDSGAQSILCRIFGSTELFDDVKLGTLYPDHASYVAAVNEATDAAVAAGFILPPDAELIRAAAADSDIGN
jgi:hypothetical protein